MFIIQQSGLFVKQFPCASILSRGSLQKLDCTANKSNRIAQNCAILLKYKYIQHFLKIIEHHEPTKGDDSRMKHTPIYENCRLDLEAVLALEEKYGIADDDLRRAAATLDEFHVVTPVVGKFSAGKSSLLNALLGKSRLGKDYLHTQITPETAVPTEIRYGSEERIILHRKDGTQEEITLEAFTAEEYRSESLHSIELSLPSDALRDIAAVKIVDMPGFDSGIEMHNRAIDDYLPKSHAYIITFEASEPLIADSIVRFLQELKLHEMPVRLVLTKADKVTAEQLAAAKAQIQSDAAKYLGIADAALITTTAKGKNVDVTAFQEILQEIEAESETIFERTTRTRIKKEAARTEEYLAASIKKADLAPDELAAEEEACRRQLERLKSSLEKEKSAFVRQIDESAMNIGGSVEAALQGASGDLERLMMNGSNISAKVNALVRQAALAGLKSDFEPRLHRYLQRIADVMQIDIAAQMPQLSPEQMGMDAMTKEVLKKSLPLILSIIGAVVTGPIGAVIALAAGLLIELGFLKKQQNDRLQLVRQKLQGEIIPEVVTKTEAAIRSAITAQMKEIDAMIGAEAESRIAVQEKALADLREAREKAAAERDARLAEMKEDLAAVQSIQER